MVDELSFLTGVALMFCYLNYKYKIYPAKRQVPLNND